MPSSLLRLVSLTGADDAVDPAALQRLSEAYPLVEWALLYVPYAEGLPRNPRQGWRQRFFDTVKGATAVHLCGVQAFEELLTDRLPSELLRADRLQLNINVRRQDFTRAQVLDVYAKAMQMGPKVILQYHADSAEVIEAFLTTCTPSDLERCHVLLDASRGLGQVPERWDAPTTLPANVLLGFAGGLGPANMAAVYGQLKALHRPFWMDMESGIRTDNVFDLAKCEAVLKAVQPQAC